MPTKVPQLKFLPPTRSNKFAAHIALDGKSFHRILELSDFYESFGYTRDMAATGLLPEEFIWIEYIENTSGDFSECFQMHILEYLMKHSDAFSKQYGHHCESWFDAHAEIRRARGIECAGCRFRPLCDKVGHSN